ncbi:MAG: Ig-like domain-containing protein [Candidatus Latescibacterota bacterium]|jgi:hypothetical protein
MRAKVLLTAFLLVLWLAPDASAGTNAGFTVSITSATSIVDPQPGQAIRVSIGVQNAVQAKGVTVTARYDASLLAYEGFAAGPLIPGMSTVAGTPTPAADGLTLVQASGTQLSGTAGRGSGLLGTLSFRVRSAAPFGGTFISIVEVTLDSGADRDSNTFDTGVLGVSLVPASLSVAEVEPQTRATGIPPQLRQIRVWFSIPINPASLTPDSILVQGDASGVVPTSVAYSAPDQLLTMQPERSFYPGETVTVRLPSAIRSTSGSSLTGGYVWSFTIADPADLDFDGDGALGFSDYFSFADVFGCGTSDRPECYRFDTDGSGRVGYGDFFIFAENFGRPTTGVVVPSPPGPRPGIYANAGATFGLSSASQIAGMGPGQDVALTLNASGLVGVKQFEILLEVSPAEAFILDAASCRFARIDTGSGYYHNPLPGVSPGVEVTAGRLRAGVALVSGPPLTGAAVLGTFTLTTAESFGPGSQAAIRVVEISVGPNSTERDVFTSPGLEVSVAAAFAEPSEPSGPSEPAEPSEPAGATAFSLISPTLLTGIGPNATVPVTVFASGMVDVKQADIWLEVSPASAFVLDQSGVSFVPGGPFGSAISPGPEFPASTQVKAGLALLFGLPINGDGILATFTLTTAASFTPTTQATVEVVKVSLGRSRTTRVVIAPQGLVVTINPPTQNRPPTLASIGGQSVAVGEALSLPLSATDPDGDTLSYSVAGNPTGSSLLDRTFVWTPSPGQVGSYLVTFTVSDGRSGADTTTVSITVEAAVQESPVSIDFNLANGDQQQVRTGGAVPGKAYRLQLNVRGAPEIGGWGATVEYDSTQLRYVRGSFQASDFIADLLALVDDKPGKVGVGGAVLGTATTASGGGTLGVMSFEVLEGFKDSTVLAVTTVTFRRTNGVPDTRTVWSSAVVTSAAVAVALPGDFDGSGQVDFGDFFMFADAFGGSDTQYDLDDNGQVDFGDFFVFADNFGREERAKLMALARQHLGLPMASELESTYPNPFNASTTVRYRLSDSGPVRLAVYGLTGQVIRVLADSRQQSGFHEVTWDGLSDGGGAAATGTYLIRLECPSRTQVRKVTLLR